MTAAAHPLRAFFLTWFGQLVSLLGSGLTSFALGVQVYNDSGGSITQFSLVYFFYYLPPLLLAPFAGALVDRWDRRRAMLLADLGAGAVAVLTYAILVAAARGVITLRPAHLYLPMALNAACDAIRWPAYFAATSLLVPKEQLGRANALLELASGLSQIVAPGLAGVLVVHIKLQGVLLADFATFLFAVGTLLAVRFPPPPESDEGRAARGSLLHEMASGWSFVRARPGLVGLLGFAAVYNLVLVLVTLLFTPLVLSFADVPALGGVLSFAGLGALAGGVAGSAWGGPKRRIAGLVLLQCTMGGVLLLALGPPSVVLAWGVAFAVLSLHPLIASALQTVWQRKVPPDLHGRVFAVRRMISLAAPPVAALLTGPLTEGVFGPAFQPGGALAGSVGAWIGAGPGAGIRVLIASLGLLGVANAALAWLSPRVRRVEEDLPDMLPDVAARPQAEVTR